MADTIHIAIPAVGDAFKFYAQVTAYTAKRDSSLPIEIHYISECDFARALQTTNFKPQTFSAYHGSSITWSRLFLPELFPDLDWILSCDADIMFLGDIAELWKLKNSICSIRSTRLNEIWALPSRDNPLPGLPYNQASVGWLAEKGLVLKHPEEYFCAGLTLFNLKAMREGGWSQMRDEFIAKYGIDGLHDADQCLLNWLLRDHRKLLPRQWGLFSGDENADIDWAKPCAVHFVEDTPWKRWKCTHLASDLYELWWSAAHEVIKQVRPASHFITSKYKYKGCKSRLDYFWRRAVYLFLKHNQWILRLHPKLWLHLRSTRGVRR